MKYKVRFNYCFEVEVESDSPSPSEIFKAADRVCPDEWSERDRFCEEIVYDGWTYEEVGA